MRVVHARAHRIGNCVDDPHRSADTSMPDALSKRFSWTTPIVRLRRPRRSAQNGDLRGRSPSFGRDVHAGRAESAISVDDPSNQPSRPRQTAQNRESHGRFPSFEPSRTGKRVRIGNGRRGRHGVRTCRTGGGETKQRRLSRLD